MELGIAPRRHTVDGCGGRQQYRTEPCRLPLLPQRIRECMSRPSRDGNFHASHLKDLDLLDASFDDPNLTTFTGSDASGLRITVQRLEPGRDVLACCLAHDDATPAAVTATS